MTELITPPGAPVAAGPYSPGLLTGDRIFLSGQGGFDPETGGLVSDNIADQTAHVFRNIEVLLRSAGASLDDVAVGARLRRALTSGQDHVTEAPATRPEPVAGRRRAARSGTPG